MLFVIDIDDRVEDYVQGTVRTGSSAVDVPFAGWLDLLRLFELGLAASYPVSSPKE